MPVRPFVPGAICARSFNRGDFLHPVAWDHLCPKRTISPENNFNCGKVTLPTCCCFSPFLVLVAFVYIYFNSTCPFLFPCRFLLFSFSELFQPRMRCKFFAHSRIICSHGLAESRKLCWHQKRKVSFALIWLILSAWSFMLCLTVFATHLPIRFMMRRTYSTWFWSKFSFSCT